MAESGVRAEPVSASMSSREDGGPKSQAQKTSKSMEEITSGDEGADAKPVEEQNAEIAHCRASAAQRAKS